MTDSRRLVALVLAGCFVCAPAAEAQRLPAPMRPAPRRATAATPDPKEQRWSNLSTLRVGETIHVYTRRTDITGPFVSVEVASLVMRVNGADVVLQRDEVVLVQHGVSMAKSGAVFGAVGGALTGLAISGIGDGSDPESRWKVTGVLAAIGAISGAVRGLLTRRTRVVYRAP